MRMCHLLCCSKPISEDGIGCAVVEYAPITADPKLRNEGFAGGRVLSDSGGEWVRLNFCLGRVG